MRCMGQWMEGVHVFSCSNDVRCQMSQQMRCNCTPYAVQCILLLVVQTILIVHVDVCT